MKNRNKTTAEKKWGKIPPRAQLFYRLIAMPKEERDKIVEASGDKQLAWAIKTFFNPHP